MSILPMTSAGAGGSRRRALGSLRVILPAVIGIIIFVVLGWSSAARAATMSYLDDGHVRVGVDLSRGGTITYLAPHGGASVVNEWDLGREIQQSYYAGPTAFGHTTKTPYNPWPWNPVAAGDTFGHPSRTVQVTNNGTTLYVKSIPQEWALDNVPCQCTFEQWITVRGSEVHVQNRLTNARTDHTEYPARDQELPAIYTNGPLYRLVTYDGTAPGTGAPVHYLGSPWPAKDFAATEHWEALVNASGWGLGVFNPDTTRFGGGFCTCGGTAGTGGASDGQTGYMAPVTSEVLDSNIVYDYSYDLVLGTVAQIRQFALEHEPDPRPDLRFASDRQHTTYQNATDTGWPIQGALHMHLDKASAGLVGPEQDFAASQVPTLYVRMALRGTAETTGQLFWDGPGQTFSQARHVNFSVIPDGHYHTYAITLAGVAGYSGMITRIALLPVALPAPGGIADIAYLGWRAPAPPAATTAPAAAGSARVGSTLSCAPGTWTGSQPIGLVYGWTRDGQPIAGAESATYALTAADAGHQVACVISASSWAGATAASSPAVALHAPPRLAARLARRLTLTARGAPVRVRCDEPCSLEVRAHITLARGQGLRSTPHTLRAGRWTTLWLRAPERERRRLAARIQRHKRVALTVQLSAHDATGNATTLGRSARIVAVRAARRRPHHARRAKPRRRAA